MKIPADEVETGRVMLLNDERWHIAETNIKPETMTFFLSKEGAHITLEVPRDYEVEVLDEFYIGRTLTLWGREWRVVHPEEGQYEERDGYNDEVLVPVSGSINQILAEYFDIDLNKIEAEKRAMLAAITEANR